MDRLTLSGGKLLTPTPVMICSKCEWQKCHECSFQQGLEKLAHYEVLEEKGLLLKLPCKIGDTVYYVHSNDKIIQCKVASFIKSVHSFKVYLTGTLLEENATYWIDDWYDIGLINKTVFLTLEEAEKALKECEKE